MLIPAYNVEKYLPQCLDSVLAQTYRDLQIVVIDDGSNDGTWMVMQEFAAKDDRIEIYHQENQGVAETRNRLLDRIIGDYFLFIDADDWIESVMVDYLISQAINSGAEMVLCGMVKNNGSPSANDRRVLFLTQSDAVSAFLKHGYFTGSLCNKLLKASLLNAELKFQRGISYGEDALFVWEILQRVGSVISSDNQLYHYRMNEGSISHRHYGESMMSGHIVWKTISEEASKLWPQYAEIALVNYAVSDMWQIYYGAKDNYQLDGHIRSFQQNIRNHISILLKSPFINLKTKIFALFAAYCYPLCKILTRI